MKRWILGLLIALALVVFVSPGIVGKLAERNLKHSIRRIDDRRDDFVVTEEKFERGWFTAAGRHRIALGDGGLRSVPAELALLVDPDRKGALIVDTRVDHGPLPVISMARDAGSLKPALARSVSTFSLDRGDGELLALPGTLLTTISLGGETTSRYALDAGSHTERGIELAWDGADLELVVDGSASSLRYDGAIEPLRLLADGSRLESGGVRFAGHSDRSEYGFGVGELRLYMQPASLADGSGVRRFERLRLEADSSLEEGRVSGRSTLEVEALSLPAAAGLGLSLDISLADLDAAAFGRLIESLEAARDTAGGTDEPVYPQIEQPLQALLLAGGELRLDRFDLTLPQGKVAASLALRVPQAARPQAFSWAELLLASTATADVRLPAELVAAVEDANPQAGALVAMGFLKRDGDRYRLEAEYAKGLLTVNGAPLPLPLGLLD